MMKSMLRTLILVGLPLTLFFASPSVEAATYTVTGTGNSGAGTLRQAIIDANANAGADTIVCDAALSGTITVSTALPTLVEAVTLDCSDAASMVTLTTSDGSLTGLTVDGTGAYVIQGLTIDAFTNSIRITHASATVTLGGTGAAENLVVSNASNAGILVDESTSVLIQNTQVDGNLTGVDLFGTAASVTIGGTLSSQRNVIINNTTGIKVSGTTTGANIINNYIGLEADGSTAAGNTQVGIRVLQDASSVVIGGASSAHGNVIGNSVLAGISAEADGLSIQNNIIGLNAAGTVAHSNYDGILVVSSNNIIQENHISGNSNTGVILRDDEALVDGNQILDNNIGLNLAEDTKRANGRGIVLSAAASFGVTDTLIQDNRISGNTSHGVEIREPIITGTQIWGNIIGSNASFATSLGNGGYALSIEGDDVDMDASANNAKRNVVIGNTNAILISEASGAVIKNNYLGWNGTAAATNGGILIALNSGASDNQIGGIAVNEANTLCADTTTNEYVNVASTAGDGNAIRGNRITCAIGLNGDPMISVTATGNNSYATAPTITTLTSAAVAGTGACFNCSVDVYGYVDTPNLVHVSAVTANGSGAFSQALDLSAYTGAIFAYTDALGNTSTSTELVPLSDAPSNYLISNTNNSGAGSLRAALLNAETSPGINELSCDPDLTGTITLSAFLPSLTEGLTLDCSDTASIITIDGGAFTVFDVDSGSNYIFKGLKIQDATTLFDFASSVSNVTLGGTGTGENIYLYDPTGTAIVSAADGLIVQNTEIDLANVGISITSGSSDVQLGIAHASGGLSVHDSSSAGIVLDGADDVAIYNVSLDDNGGTGSVTVQGSSSNVVIGGTGTNQRNIITGGSGAGIASTGATSLEIVNNYIGLNADGTTANGNSGSGISVSGTCTSCVIGGDLSAEGNVIGSSTQNGILVSSSGVTIQNNKIGTNALGTAARANGGQGIDITASNITVEDNLISGNSQTGITVGDGAARSGIVIDSNTIGLQADQATALGNTGVGINLNANSGNGIVGTVIQNNIISSNGGNGVNVEGATTTGTKIWGNKIGADVTGLLARGNSGDGIRLSGASSDLDASVTASKRNIIVDNSDECIKINSSSNVIRNQYCGYAADGTTELPNGGTTMSLGDGAADNIIGGIAANQGNLVCASAAFNVYFLLGADAANGNSIRGNTIGCDDFRIPLVDVGDLITEMITRPLGGTANENYDPPTFTVATELSVRGSDACANCSVDIYGQDAARAAVYIGTDVADGDGDWAFEVDLSDYDYAIATYTDAGGSTSTAHEPIAVSAQADGDGDGIFNVTEVRAGTSDSLAADNDTVAEQARTLFLASDDPGDGVPLILDMTNEEATDGGSTPLLINVVSGRQAEYEAGFADPTTLDLPAYATPGYPTRAELQAVIDAVNADNAPVFTITQSGGTTTMQEEATDSFTVVLSGLQPTSDVVFNVSSADTGAVTVSPSTLTFTNGNWDTPQTVTLTGVADDDTANESVVITLSVNDASSDDGFDALADQTLTATVTDTTEEEPVSGSGGGGGSRPQASDPSEPNPEEPRPDEEIEPEVLVIVEPTITETLVSEKDASVLGDEFTIEEGRRYGYPIGAFDVLADKDMDGLPYLDEVVMLSSNESSDTDGDGIADGLEVLTGTDPLNPNEFKIDALDITLSCPEEGTFTDTGESFARVAICILVQQKIVQGRQPELFFPNEEVTRAELTKMILLTAGVQPKSIPAQSFEDLDFDAWYYPYVTTARKIGLVEGYADGTFKPNQSITRAEAVSILIRAFRGEDQSVLESPYQDVFLTDWFAHNVLLASQDGLIVGRTPGFFAPFGTLTRAEAVILIRRAQYAYAQ